MNNIIWPALVTSLRDNIKGAVALNFVWRPFYVCDVYHFLGLLK